MRFSAWPSFARPWDELMEFARYIEDTGWHGLWYADHYMSDRPDGAVSDEPALECWSVLAALASRTTRIRLGSLVSPTSVHHPALLAKRAATIDQISHGRLTLGLGAGWQVNEHRAYGIELEAPKPRVDRFEEAITIVASMLYEKRTDFTGACYKFTDAPCEPKPVQAPLPILVGTAGPRMSKITARHAHEWNSWGTPEVVGNNVNALEGACEKVGRDPLTLRKTAQALVFLVDDSTRAGKVRANAPEGRSLVGNSHELAEQLSHYAALGIDEFIVPDFTLGRDKIEREDSYERIRTEVIPLVEG